jgi:cytochrome c2
MAMQNLRNAVPLVLVTLLATMASAAADIEHGKQLHNRNCTSCHTSMYGGDGSGIYTRPNRRINDITALNNQVSRCAGNLGLGWSDTDMQSVSGFLNNKYYKFE